MEGFLIREWNVQFPSMSEPQTPPPPAKKAKKAAKKAEKTPIEDPSDVLA